MSLMPIFRIGILNAWIFLIPVLFMHIINSRVFARRGGFKPSKIYLAFFIFLNVLPIFMPLQLNAILFPFGVILYIMGIAISFQAISGFATTAIDKPVSKGVFRYSRNPMYLGAFIFCFGVSFVCISWIYFLIVLIWVFVTNFLEIPGEESECIKKYGASYLAYMNRTPKWLGIPKREKAK